MVYSLAYNILYATIIPVTPPLMIAAIAMFLVIFAVIFNNHYTFLITLGLLLIAALIVYIRWDDAWMSEASATGAAAYIRDLILFVRGYEPYNESYGPVIIISVCGFLALYMALSLYVTFQFYFASLLGIGVFIVNWIMNYKRSDIPFVIFIFCFCVLLYKKLNRKKPDVNRTAIYMTPVFLLVIVCAYFLPVAGKGWNNSGTVEFFRDPLNATNDFFYFIFNPKYFSFQTTGFEGGGGRLGGSLTLNNRPIMRVTADKPTYLAGLIKDTYTGAAWLSTSPGFTSQYSADDARFETVETQLNIPLHLIFGSYADSGMTVRDLSINIGASRTGTLFRPTKSDGVDINTDLALLTDSFGDIRLSDVLPAGAEYSYKYMDINYEDPAILNILRQSRRGIYRDAVDSDMYVDLVPQLVGSQGNRSGFRRIGGYFGDQNLPDQRYIWGMWESQSRSRPGSIAFDPIVYFQDKLIPYSEYVYKTFTGVPEAVPQRVWDLAKQITAGADNDYDRAKAIESYLVKIPYTLTPKDKPNDREFVDYFLFDGKEGYCTYYASAMAVLCRCVGLPVRYVEGYIMPPERPADGVYNITNLQAHAWPEVYFEGFGWVTFEPTAPYSYSYYQTTPAPNTQIFASDFASNPDYEEYMRSMMGGSNYVFPTVNPAQAKAQAEEAKKASYLAMFLSAVALLLFICACFGALILRGQIDILLRQRYIRRLPRNGQAIEYFQDIIKMTRYYRYPMRDNETPVMYAGRIGKRFGFKSDTVFIRDLVAIYNRAKYGGAQIRREDLSVMKGCQQEMLEFLRYIKHKPVFIWNRYISRRI